MAFLIGAAVRQGVKAVQSGIQAHQDFNNPEGPQPRYDRYGQLKQPGPVYGLVMKAENKYGKKKGGSSSDPSSPGGPPSGDSAMEGGNAVQVSLAR